MSGHGVWLWPDLRQKGLNGLRGFFGSLARLRLWTLGTAAVLGILIWILTGRKAMAIGWIGDGMLFGGIVAIDLSLVLPLVAGVLPRPAGPLELLPAKEVLSDALGAAGSKARAMSLIVTGAGVLLVIADRVLEGRARRTTNQEVAPSAP